MAEPLATKSEEVISEAGTGSKVTKESKEVKQKIATRLESLEKMFSANEAGRAEGWDEEEED
jgi:hypothetical protein